MRSGAPDWLKRAGAFFILTPFLTAGCGTLIKAQPLGNGFSANGDRLYLNASQSHRTYLDQFLLRYPDFNEESKIQYLLSCIEKSRYRFIRNGIPYDGTGAMRWLRWKRRHPQYKDRPVLTAHEFIERVADTSVNSGRSYEVVLPNGQREYLKNLLNNELSSLEVAARLHHLEQSLSDTVSGQKESSSEISYAPVAVNPSAS